MVTIENQLDKHDKYWLEKLEVVEKVEKVKVIRAVFKDDEFLEVEYYYLPEDSEWLKKHFDDLLQVWISEVEGDTDFKDSEVDWVGIDFGELRGML